MYFQSPSAQKDLLLSHLPLHTVGIGDIGTGLSSIALSQTLGQKEWRQTSLINPNDARWSE